MNVLIIGDFSFPHGTGASARVYAYAAGLRANGVSVKVLCVQPTEGCQMRLNIAAKGSYRGIDFEYACGRTDRPSSLLARRFLRVAKWWRFLRSVHVWGGQVGGVDAIIVYSRSIAWILAARLGCWMTGALLIHEDCELPFGWHSDTAGRRARRWLYEHVAFKWFDACLAISTYLRDYCGRHLRYGAEVLLVPILVNVTEADCADQVTEDVVTYCGYATHPEVAGLIEAFAMVAPSFPDLRLRVIGPALRPDLLPTVWDLARRLGVAERLDLVGRVRREELGPLLCSARVLALPRPDAPFSRAGLPTKLGEYLATARPVVVTAVGDIPLYLQDGVDAYLAPPDDVTAFAERIRYVLLNEVEASAVGSRGREAAREEFDPAIHAKRIMRLIEDLNGRRRTRVAWRRVGGAA